MKRDELLNWMPHIEAEFDRRGLDTYAMLVSRATEMLQRDEETIAALEAERDQLRAEYAAYGVDMGRALDEVSRLRAELAECRRGAERYRTALEQIVAPFEDLNFVSGNKLLTYIHDTATAALAAKGE